MGTFVKELTAPFRALFATRQIQPPTDHYVSKNDQLSVVTRCSHATTKLDIRMRFMLLSGDVVSMRYEVTPANDRSVRETVFDLAEGYLLSALAVPTANDVASGQVLVAMYLTRGAAPAQLWHELLASGFPATGVAVSYPRNDTNAGRGAAGWDRVITGTDPAAGVEISETVPAGAVWDLVTVTFPLVTDATVANRSVSLLIDDGVSVTSWNRGAGVQAAGVSRTYFAGALNIDDGATSGRIGMGAMNDRLILAGWRIRTSTVNLQAGDNYGAPTLWVRESLVD